MIPDYLDGLHVITRVLISERKAEEGEEGK